MLRVVLLFLLLPAVLQAQQWRLFSEADGLPDNEITALAAKDSLVWVGTPAGLARYNGTSWTVVTADSGLPGNYVKSIVIAPSTLWVGTASGLARLEDSVWTSFTPSNSALPSADIRALVDWKGRLWCATAGGLAAFDGTSWTVYTTKNSQLPTDNVLSLAADDAALWVGTEGGGLARYNGTSWTVYTATNSLLPSNTIVALTASEDRLFIGLWDNLGIAVYTPSNNTWTRYANNIADGSVRCLASASCGHVWAGTRFGGLTDNRAQFAPLYQTLSSQIPGNYILSLAADSEDVWVGTQTGLAFLDLPKALYLSTPASVCQTDMLTTTFEVNGLQSCSADFRVLLSDSTGSFSTPLRLDIVAASYPFRIQIPIPASIPAGTGYRISVTEVNGLVAATSGTFSVYALPSPSITDQQTLYMCGQETLTLDAGAYAAYQWSNGATSRLLTVDQPGVYSVIVTTAEGCSAPAPPVTIERRELPAPVLELVGTTPFCESDSVVLTAGSYARYRWSTGATSATLVVKEAGIYNVSVTDSYGCTGASLSMELTTLPGPTKPEITYIAGTLYSSPAFTYQWYRNNEAIDGATARTYTPTVSGSYMVGSFNEFICRTLSEPYVLNISSVGDTPNAGFSLTVENGAFVVSGYTAAPIPLHIVVVDVPGRTVRELHCTVEAGQFRTSLSVEGLAAGTYIALCESAETRSARPFVVLP